MFGVARAIGQVCPGSNRNWRRLHPFVLLLAAFSCRLLALLFPGHGSRTAGGFEIVMKPN